MGELDLQRQHSAGTLHALHSTTRHCGMSGIYDHACAIFSAKYQDRFGDLELRSLHIPCMGHNVQIHEAQIGLEPSKGDGLLYSHDAIVLHSPTLVTDIALLCGFQRRYSDIFEVGFRRPSDAKSSFVIRMLQREDYSILMMTKYTSAPKVQRLKDKCNILDVHNVIEGLAHVIDVEFGNTLRVEV